jgi:PAS domain S-box-containing protein
LPSPSISIAPELVPVPWGEALGEDERFRLMAENASDIIYLFRFVPEPRYEYVSPSSTRITGYTPQEHYADPDLAFKIVHPPDRPLLESILRSPRAFTEPMTIRLVGKDERIVWTEHRVAPILDASGELVAVEGIARDITDRRRAEEELWRTVQALKSTDGERRKLLGQLVQAEERQRRRIAQDLHDDHIQVLVAALLRLRTVREKISDESTFHQLDALEETVRAALQRLRHLSFELHPPVLDTDGLLPALQIYVDRTSSEADVEFELESELEEEPSSHVRTILYRIALEALTNVRKHANAMHVQVLIEDRNGEILLRIHDDGVGFSPEEADGPSTGHLGLASMRERLQLAGGGMTIRSAPGAGTTLEAWVPARISPETPS